MRRAETDNARPLRAPHYAGALLFLVASLLLGACEKEEQETPDWKETKQSQEAEAPPSSAAQPPAPQPAPEPEPESAPQSESAPEPASAPSGRSSSPASDLRFLSYNLKNYLTMTRFEGGERKELKKPEKEVTALVKIVAEARPDVLGICEIGTVQDLADFQNRLTEAGLDLPHREHAGGADESRHLAFLSRFPFAATNSQGAGGTLTYNSLDAENNPSEFAMQRGILDVTIQVGPRQVRFLGVHLKSKRDVPEGHQDLMRRNEAYLLRRHADRILDAAPETLLCVYGDLNDSRRESPVRSIQGPTKSSGYLEPLPHKDSRGEVWTHYWDYQHIYSRFDYVLASPALRPHFDPKQSRIIDDPQWSVASDHRPLLTVFKFKSDAAGDAE